MATTPETKIQRFYGKNNKPLEGYEIQDMGYWSQYPSQNSTARTKLTNFGAALKTKVQTTKSSSDDYYWKVTNTMLMY